MFLRSLHYQKLDVSNVIKALLDMTVEARFIADVSQADAYLQRTPILKLISDAIANELSSATKIIDVACAWKTIDQSHWEEALQFTKGFEWQPIEHRVGPILQMADEVIAGEDSMIDGLGDPFIFKSTFRQDHEHGLNVSLVLQAMFVVSLVESHGGTFIWNRNAYESECIRYKSFPVTWNDGYHLQHNSRSKLLAQFRSGSKRGVARLLGYPPAAKDFEKPTSYGRRKQASSTFGESRDPAIAAMWGNLTVRELRLNTLANLLETDQNNLVKYAEQEGVDLADLLALGLRTAVHSRTGLVLWHKSRVLSWPSLCETKVPGYSFMVEWGLTRKMQSAVGAKRRYHYLRAFNNDNQEEWTYSVNNETYDSFPSALNKTRAAWDFVWWGVRSMISRKKEALRINKLDAQARLRRRVQFVESAEETSVKANIGDVMLNSLSNRIEIATEGGYEDGYVSCFGDRPGNGDKVLDDELVVVLSYRHEGPTVRMSIENWKYCYEDITMLTLIHGKTAARVWTDKLSSMARKDASWIESGVEPYRNGVVLAFNSVGDSIFVDRFWISMERNTAVQAWGYWVRDDLGQITRMATREYPARMSDRAFLRQILFTPGRADGTLWEEDRLEVIREAADMLGVRDVNSFWDCLCEQQFERMFIDLSVLNQERACGDRVAKGWEPLADCLVDRDLIEKSLKFELKDRYERKVVKWRTGEFQRAVAVESWTSDRWFSCLVALKEVEGRLKVVDILGRRLMTMEEMAVLYAASERCDDELWE